LSHPSSYSIYFHYQVAVSEQQHRSNYKAKRIPPGHAKKKLMEIKVPNIKPDKKRPIQSELVFFYLILILTLMKRFLLKISIFTPEMAHIENGIKENEIFPNRQPIRQALQTGNKHINTLP
jgi:hypothetical protein